MNFFDSISVPFRLWQITCLSPYHLEPQKHQTQSNFQRNCSFIAIFIQLLIAILVIIFFNTIVSQLLNQTVKVLDGLTVGLAQLTALTIFWESYRKRQIQRNFFHKINSVDFLMEFKIGVRPDYTEKKKSNTRRTICWLVLNALNFIVNLIVLSIAFDTSYRWWIVFYVSYSIYSLRYHQIITCVDLIHYRYQLLNRFINQLKTDNVVLVGGGGVGYGENMDENRSMLNADGAIDIVKTTIDNDPVTIVLYQRNRKKSDVIHEKIHYLRRICRLLSSANHNLNETFQWSMPLIIVNDFLQILINWFWILRLLLRPNIRVFLLIPPSFWTTMNFVHVVSISAICHYATEEVNLKKLIIVKWRSNKGYIHKIHIFRQNIWPVTCKAWISVIGI